MLSPAQIQQFKIDGYLILPNQLSEKQCAELRALVEQHLQERVQPFELESSLNYPGAPKSQSAPGGDTIRRLLLAQQRSPLGDEIARLPKTLENVAQILGGKELFLNPNHHNCFMTKHPRYSSETLWHRDTRYWNFNNKYLVNVWYALGEEQVENGAMKVLPGSHRWDIQEDALDEAQFLKPEHPFNQDRLATSRTVPLNPGDALYFSAHCFHAAGKNTTEKTKYSLVFTYHNEKTKVIPDTRSSTLDAIKL